MKVSAAADMNKTDILVSVVLICHNDGKWLPRCIESLRQQTIPLQMELIIVDNASSDGTDTTAKSLIAGWSRARFISTGGDNGFAVACNRGAEAASGKFVYLLSPDTWLEPDCLEQFVLAVELQGANAAGCTILEYEDNTIQAQGSHGFDIFGFPVSPRQGRVPEPLFCIAGFAFIERTTFLAIGKLDETLFMYGEELDLAWRVWSCGYKMVAAPQARVHHRGAVLVNPAGGTRAVENRTSTQKRFLANRNSLVILAKNGRHLLGLLLVPCSFLILSEFLATLVISRSWSVARMTSLDAFKSAWNLKSHIRAERKVLRGIRKHGDLWMLRFFRFGFGRWGEIEKMLRMGFPRISQSHTDAHK